MATSHAIRGDRVHAAARRLPGIKINSVVFRRLSSVRRITQHATSIGADYLPHLAALEPVPSRPRRERTDGRTDGRPAG